MHPQRRLDLRALIHGERELLQPMPSGQAEQVRGRRVLQRAQERRVDSVAHLSALEVRRHDLDVRARRRQERARRS